MPPPLISSDTTRNRPSHRSLIVVLEKGFAGETNERCFEVAVTLRNTQNGGTYNNLDKNTNDNFEEDSIGQCHEEDEDGYEDDQGNDQISRDGPRVRSAESNGTKLSLLPPMQVILVSWCGD